MMVLTIPVAVPVVAAAGVDPVWFGIFIILMCELGMVTPPVGMNLYVVQGVRGGGPVTDVFVGVLPFILALLIMIVLVIVFPGIVMSVPQWLYG